MFSADLVQEEVDPPANRWCSCNHQAPLFFRRNGPNTPEELTKFFKVSNNSGYIGTYCEPCLIIAHYQASLKKKGLI